MVVNQGTMYLAKLFLNQQEYMMSSYMRHQFVCKFPVQCVLPGGPAATGVWGQKTA